MIPILYYMCYTHDFEIHKNFSYKQSVLFYGRTPYKYYRRTRPQSGPWISAHEQTGIILYTKCKYAVYLPLVDKQKYLLVNIYKFYVLDVFQYPVL